MKLGRLQHDPAAFAAAPAHRFGAMLAPPVVNRRAVNVTPGLYENDRLPDCTAVSMANAARCVAALNGYQIVVDPKLVPAFYGACIGASPDANLAATPGAQMLEVLNHQTEHSFPIGPQGLVGKWGTINPHDRNALALAISRFGHVWAGVSLRDRDVQFPLPVVWDVVNGRDDGPIAGGHAVNFWDYTGLSDESTVRIGTWGAWQSATWAWIEARIEEAYALAWRQLARADGNFYSGVNADGLYAELPVA